jgi:23S rRNA (cytosine1962-C5)-methyltransferase
MPPETTYKLLDAGAGARLEQWGPYRLKRPDPRATMRPILSRETWGDVDARYEGEAGKGRWVRVTAVPERWPITHGGVTLVVKLAPFKHTGVFPEQAKHWNWMRSVATAAGRQLTILNLFAYTGGATMALAKAGHLVTHVDASKPALAWARENAAANALLPDAVRWIQDDAATFVKREVKRGKHYDAVVMDPPAFGRTPEGRVWKLRDDLPPLLASVAALLENPAFVLINDYSRDADHEQLAQLLDSSLQLPRPKPHARAEAGTLRLSLADGRALDTGAFARWHDRPAAQITSVRR